MKYDHYLEWRLRCWGYWLDRMNKGEEGWPSSSIIAVVMELGNYLPSGKPFDPPSDDLVSEVNTLINRLSVLFPHYAKAIKLWYLPTGGKTKERAKKLGVSVSTFKDWKDSGKMWLSGRFDAEVDKKNAPYIYDFNKKKDDVNCLTGRADFA